ncbi:MAG: alkaline phosphatase PhoX [Planctomycetota bacterium]
MFPWHSRRQFLKQTAAFAGSFAALRDCVHAATHPGGSGVDSPYGPLVRDPEGLLDLPRGFSYQVISRTGAAMSDGLITPPKPDGMATFEGPDGVTLLLRNHESEPDFEPSPFGEGDALLSRLDPRKVYDSGPAAHRGGVSTVVYDTRNRRVVRDFLSLAGTARNCAGGPTPWGSWITCEETVWKRGDFVDEVSGRLIRSAEDHGYNFEVPARAEIGMVDPVPLRDMGRFVHEAVAVDPATGVVYETEDRDDGLIYRFLPNKPGQIAAGGRLQALVVRGRPSTDTRNWDSADFSPGGVWEVQWIDMQDVESPNGDLHLRGHAAGAARFARGEGMWYSKGQVFFACTSGGRRKLGQIWRYQPGHSAKDGGRLELFVESNDSALLVNADNLTASPWGDLFVCEDRDGPEVRIVGVTPSGGLYTFAHNHAQSEFAGVTFSPDASTLFVNLQHEGMTVAIHGPWVSRA